VFHYKPYPVDAAQPSVDKKEPAEAQLNFDSYWNAPTRSDLGSGTVAPPVKDGDPADIRAANDAPEFNECGAVTEPSHYTQWKIQPISFIMRNDMPFWMGNVLKYCMRADQKNGVEDLRKAIRYIEFRINQLEGEVDITK
jgi:hypothetical protein